MTFMLDLKSESFKVEKGKFEFAVVKCNISFKMTNGLKSKSCSLWLLRQTDLPVAYSAYTPVQQLVTLETKY